MSISTVIQQQSVYFTGSMNVLRYLLTQLTGTVEALDDKKLRAFQAIDISLENKMVTLEVRPQYSFTTEIHSRIINYQFIPMDLYYFNMKTGL